MCTSTGKQAGSVELADIFSHHADSYIAQHGVSSIQHKAINAISHCRTAQLGGHVLRCNHCGALEIAYNSCRYRHCPKCQAPKKIRWLEARKAEVLPVPYFHVVFTIPHELNPIASYNPSVIYNLLFKAAWATVNTLGHDKKRLNGQIGMTAFLHTWNQKLNQHIHLHCMVPAGAITDVDGELQWRASKENYLFPHKVMSKLFGKLFLTELHNAFTNQALNFKGCIADLAKKQQFMKFRAHLSTKSWNVYAKEPFNGAEGGMEYLARYFTKTAIGNERLLSFDAHQVTFKWRDSRHNNQTKTIKLEVHEFIRRYLSHILPDGFMRVRYFGFLANAVKVKNITLIRSLLSKDKASDTHVNLALKNSANSSDLVDVTAISHCALVSGSEPAARAAENQLSYTRLLSNTPYTTSIQDTKKTEPSETIAELMKRVAGIDITRCKQCKTGHLEQIQAILPNVLRIPSPWDTS